MSEAPERIWVKTRGVPKYYEFPCEDLPLLVEYVRADHIEELEAGLEHNKKRMLVLAGDKINLVSELAGVKGKLAKAVEALDEAVYLLAPDEKDMVRQAGVYRIVTTLALLKGEKQ